MAKYGWVFVDTNILTTINGPTGSIQFRTGNGESSGSYSAVYSTSSATVLLGGTKDYFDTYAHTLGNETLHVTGNVTISGTLEATQYHTNIVSSSIIYSSGSTKFGNSSDDIHQVTGAAYYNHAVNVTGTLTLGASSKLASVAGSDLTIDSAADIYLDAAGGEIIFKDGSTNVGHVSMASDNLTFKSLVSDKDIVFLGRDSGVSVTALTLDMSAGGTATFNDKVVATELDITTGGAISGSGASHIVGAATFSSTIAASGNIDTSGDLTAATITMSGFAVDSDGDTTVKSLSVDTDSTIGCDADTDLLTLGNGTLRIQGAVSGSGTFQNGGSATFSSTIAATGSITSGGSFIIGSADINETDLEKIDGITNGTAAANKAVVLDSNKAITGITSLTASTITAESLFVQELHSQTRTVGVLEVSSSIITVGSGAADSAEADGFGLHISGAAASLTWDHSNTRMDLNKALAIDTALTIDTTTITDDEIGVLDGVTPGTAAANKALVVDGSKHIGTLGTITAASITGSKGKFAMASGAIIATGSMTLGKVAPNNGGNLVIEGSASLQGPFTGSQGAAFPDGMPVFIGTAGDLQVYHDGANTYLKNNTGNLVLQSEPADKDIRVRLGSDNVESAFQVRNDSNNNIFKVFGSGKVSGSGPLDIEGDIRTTGSLIVGDGMAVTLTSTELGYIDGLTTGTAAASKAVVLDGNKAITGMQGVTASTFTALGGFHGDGSGITNIAAGAVSSVSGAKGRFDAPNGNLIVTGTLAATGVSTFGSITGSMGRFDLTNGNLIFSGSIHGDGSTLTGVSATNITGAKGQFNTANGNLIVTGSLQMVGFEVEDDGDVVIADDATIGSATTEDMLTLGANSLTVTIDTATFTSANNNDPLVSIKNTANHAGGGRLRFINDKGAAGADDDVAGAIEFYSDDDNQDNIEFARIEAIVADASNGAEGGQLKLSVATHDGEIQPGLILTDGSAEDEVDVTIGNGAASVTTAAGNLTTGGMLKVGSAAGSGKDVFLYTAGTAAHVGIQWDADGNTEGTLIGGADDHGVDFKLFGEPAGNYVQWDMSGDELVLAATSKLSFNDAAGDENIVASADGHLEINAGTTLDMTAPTVDINASTEVTIDSDHVTVSSTAANDPTLTLKNARNDATGARLRFTKDKGAAGAAGDAAGTIEWYADDANQDQVLFAAITGSVAVHTNGQEGGKLTLSVASHDGELVNGIVIIDGDAEDEIDVTIGSGASSVITVPGTMDIAGDVDIAGDLTLSAGADGALEFTNASENSIKVPDNVANALIIEEADNAYMTFDTSNLSERIKLSQHTTIIDDKKLYFGTGEDWHIEYDEDGDDVLRMGGIGMVITTDTATFTSANANDPLVIIKNTTNDTNGGTLRLVNDKGAAGADNDICGQIQFYGDDDNQDNIEFASIIGQVADASNGAEGGKLIFRVASHDGEANNGLIIQDGDAEDEIDVIIANGDSSMTTVSGDFTVSGDTVLFGPSTAADDPLVEIKNTRNDATGARLRFTKDKGAAGAAGDVAGTIEWYADDANQDQVLFAAITGSVATHTNGQEGGKLTLSVASHDGELVNGIVVIDGNGEDRVDVTIGNGAASTQTIAGSLDVTADLTTTGNAVNFNSSTANKPLVQIKNTTNDTNSGLLRFVKDKGAAGADNDIIGKIEFYGDDDNQDNIEFANIIAQVADATNGEEGGRLTIQVASHDGEMVNALIVQDGSSEDAVDVIVGNSNNGCVIQVNSDTGIKFNHPALTGYANDTGAGDILRDGAGTLTAGKLYFMPTGSTTWSEVDASTDQSGSGQLLGIALGTSPTNNGMLIRGFFDAHTYLSGTFTRGAPVYMSTGGGHMQVHPPSGSDEQLRVVGHCTTQSNVIYFNPSSTWIEID